MNDNATNPTRKNLTDSISYGPKYDEKLSMVQIAARVRAEIKAAVRANQLPRAKYSVRIDGNSYHSSLRVRISRVPFNVLNPHKVFHDADHPREFQPLPRYTEEAEQLLTTVTQLVSAYNFDGSDIESDYFHVRFYKSVDFAHEETMACREALLTARAPA